MAQNQQLAPLNYTNWSKMPSRDQIWECMNVRPNNCLFFFFHLMFMTCVDDFDTFVLNVKNIYSSNRK